MNYPLREMIQLMINKMKEIQADDKIGMIKAQQYDN